MSSRQALIWLCQYMPGNIRDELLTASRGVVNESQYHMPEEIWNGIVDKQKLINIIAYGGISILDAQRAPPYHIWYEENRTLETSVEKALRKII